MGRKASENESRASRENGSSRAIENRKASENEKTFRLLVNDGSCILPLLYTNVIDQKVDVTEPEVDIKEDVIRNRDVLFT